MAVPSVRPSESADPLHVLHVADEDFAARFGRMLRLVVLALDEAGLRQSLLTDSSVLAGGLDAAPIDLLKPRALYGWRAWGLPKSLDDKFEAQPDIVHFWGAAGLARVGAWAGAANLPALIYVTAQHEADELRQRGLHRNEFLATACRAFWGPLAEHFPRIGATPNLLPPALLAPETDPPVRRPVEHAMGVLWSGVFDDQSGLTTLIDALALARARGCELQAVLIGWGPGSHRIWQHIRTRGVTECVSLVAEPTLWDQVTAGTDVCVIPAPQVDLSLAPLLAMAQGTLVLAHRKQPADWLIPDRTCASFGPQQAVEELAALLRRAHQGDSALHELRASAARFVRDHHAVTDLTRRLLAAYQALLRASDSRSG